MSRITNEKLESAVIMKTVLDKDPHVFDWGVVNHMPWHKTFSLWVEYYNGAYTVIRYRYTVSLDGGISRLIVEDSYDEEPYDM